MSNAELWVLVIAVLALMALMFAFVQWRTRKAERNNPPTGRFVEVDGVRLHYTEQGSGQPVVLLHGNGTMIQDFDLSGLPGLAAQSYRVVVFDRPGYGYSTRPRGRRPFGPEAQAKLLYTALRRIGVERPIVVGHSWGTLVAVAMGLEYPAYVRSLVLLSGYYFPTFRPDVAFLSPPAIPVLGDIMRYTLSPLLGRLMWPGLLRIMFGPPAVPGNFKRRYPVWMGLRPSQLRASAAESALMVPSVIPLGRRYRELEMPVVIVAGADDRFVSARKHSERLSQELPHSKLVLTPGAGHMVHHLAPSEVMKAINLAART